MGASCAVWANALAAIKKAARNAKDSARIVSLATISRPNRKRNKSNRANQGGSLPLTRLGTGLRSRGQPPSLTAAAVYGAMDGEIFVHHRFCIRRARSSSLWQPR
jgi:hypothetical protein